tara:strand:- start:11 stop:400 length:390 start_codon:yes stop_codon:yes gene_type:complete
VQNAQNKKKRHWCLFAYLVLTLIANAFLSFVYFKTSTIQPQTAYQSLIPQWYFQVVGILCLFNLISAFAILKWKKWGFWLFTLTASIPLNLNLYFELSIVYSVGELIGVAILYGVLQIGGDKKGWSQLN